MALWPLPQGGGGSGGCAHGGNMSSRPSAWSCPQPPPQLRQGGGWRDVQRPTGTEDGQGLQRGGGARVARRAAAPEASSNRGTRPAPLVEVRPQGAMVQHSGIGFELLQALDVPVLQLVEQPVDVESFFRISVPAVAEQVIEVPNLAFPILAVQRAALPEPQLVEQLVEVPTVLSVAVLQQRTAEQIIGFPVPGHGGGARGGLQGLTQGQGSTAVLWCRIRRHSSSSRSWRRCSWRFSRPLPGTGLNSGSWSRTC